LWHFVLDLVADVGALSLVSADADLISRLPWRGVSIPTLVYIGDDGNVAHYQLVYTLGRTYGAMHLPSVILRRPLPLSPRKQVRC